MLRALIAVSLLGCGESTAAPAPIDSGTIVDAPAEVAVDTAVVWPNDESSANSDRWLRDHHDEITQLRPKILVLNYVNAKPNEKVQPLIEQIFAALRESSRYRGYNDASAPVRFDPQLAKLVDLRDSKPEGTLRNSTLYPRRADLTGKLWGFDYGKLFDAKYSELYGMGADLCTLVDQGKVHEVWVVGDGDVPDVSAAEVLEWKPRYDSAGDPIGTAGDRCAGNGCFDNDVPHCMRSLRIGWVNHSRGPGCYLESLAHGMESMSTRGVVAYLKSYFPGFAGFDLDKRHMLPFKSWYVCDREDCVTFNSPTSITYSTPDGFGKLDGYVPVCGNAHFPPNARRHYDVDHDFVVQSTCEGYRRDEKPRDFSRANFARYRELAPDCTGPWLVWWRQNWPSYGNGLRDDAGKPMKSWWPFLYY